MSIIDFKNSTSHNFPCPRQTAWQPMDSQRPRSCPIMVTESSCHLHNVFVQVVIDKDEKHLALKGPLGKWFILPSHEDKGD